MFDGLKIKISFMQVKFLKKEEEALKLKNEICNARLGKAEALYERMNASEEVAKSEMEIRKLQGRTRK
jgi:hypothetical protein